MEEKVNKLSCVLFTRQTPRSAQCSTASQQQQKHNFNFVFIWPYWKDAILCKYKMEDFQDLKKMASIFNIWIWMWKNYQSIRMCKHQDRIKRHNSNQDQNQFRFPSKKVTAWQEICSMAMPIVWLENGRYFPKGPIYSVCPGGIIRIQEIPEFLNR